MRKEDQILKQLIDWGLANPQVRIILLTSSRANPDAHIDLFSDYDIEIAVNNVEDFLANESWILTFGEVMAVIRQDEDACDGTHAMCMVIYKNYIKIDFSIYSIKKFKDSIDAMQLNKGKDGKVLLDKDGITTKLPAPNFTAFIITRPTSKEFNDIVVDFLWDTTYVAKSLWRDEIFFAKYMSENIIRFSYLQKIIEWYIGMKNNWQVTTNKYGRFFKRYLDKDIWLQLEKTFSGSGIEENWDGLFAMMNIFRNLASSIARELNYEYPQQLDDDITTYLGKVRDLDKNATDL